MIPWIEGRINFDERLERQFAFGHISNQVRMTERESGPVVPHHYFTFGGMANSQGEDETRNPSHRRRYSFESEDDIFPLDHGLKYPIYLLVTKLTDPTLLRGLG